MTGARAPGLWAVRVDPSQLESALLNLCINARDALPTGGRITIETRNVTLDRDYALSQEDEVAKLRLVVETASEVWGTA